MNINQMLYFKTVCKHLNITKAAYELHISQPAITKSIHELESELGVPLLVRVNKKISLTHEGEIFLNKCQALLSDFYSLIDEMKDLGLEKQNTVKIGIPPTIGTIILPKLIVEIKKTFHLDLEIFEASSDDCIRAIEEDELDLAIVLLENCLYPKLDSHVLHHSSLCFCTNASNPLSKKDCIDLQELENEKLILFSPGVLIEQLLASHGITPKYILHSNQVLTIKSFINANLASTFQFPEAFSSEKFICSVPLETPISLDICVIRRKGKYTCSNVRQIFDYVKRDFQCF